MQSACFNDDDDDDELLDVCGRVYVYASCVSGLIWPGVVATDTVLPICQIELFDIWTVY